MTGKQLSFLPDRKLEQCDKVTSYNPEPSHISGWAVPYYIIPLWHESFDNSKENLRIGLSFKIKGSYNSLSSRSLLIYDLTNKKSYWPISIKNTSNIRHKESKFLRYEAEFDVSAEEIHDFELQFQEKIYTCSIPPVKYKKSEHRFYVKP
tara:strand:+ start:214 stop:663 length:450 start_codon:yes stop_codon:yes gene_type:complete